MLRDNPGLARLPVALADRSLATLTGFQIEMYGFAVQAPWSNMGTIRMASDVAIAPFPDQHVAMMLFKPGDDDFEVRMGSEAAHGRDESKGISSYNLMYAEMMSTPDQVKWWNGRDENEARSFLLEMKSFTIGNLRDIYSVSAGGLRGFQAGDPAIPPYRVRLDLFDSADRHYQIRIESTDKHGPVISQAQINAMVASIRQIPAN
jgi:hypothetical protein